jgi:hypothetical protein
MSEMNSAEQRDIRSNQARQKQRLARHLVLSTLDKPYPVRQHAILMMSDALGINETDRDMAQARLSAEGVIIKDTATSYGLAENAVLPDDPLLGMVEAMANKITQQILDAQITARSLGSSILEFAPITEG